MKALAFNVLALWLGLGAVGCGEFSNAPFREGTVRGRLTEVDPAVALVSVVGAPGVRTRVAEDGTFRLGRVPAGPVELLAIASVDTAARVEVVVPGGQSVEVPPVAPRPAGFLEVRVKAPARQRLDVGQLSVKGTSYQRLQLDAEGGLRVGPLPKGCWRLEVSVPGFPVATAESCVGEGERQEVPVALPTPGEDFVHRGCKASGCPAGSLCTADGRCVQCFADSHCAPGLMCRNERCEGPGATCAACDGNWQCRPGTFCEDLPEGSAACVARCDATNACATGFSCQGGRCLPDGRLLAGCFASRQVGSPCVNDRQCLERGLGQGLCVEGRCTLRCALDTECPEGFGCAVSTAGATCKPLR